jgi:hypothetical protein
MTTLFELQAWPGHRSPLSTQYYAKILPTTLARACADAGYFARNVCAIEALVDRESVQKGTAAGGSPWQYSDLGHGFCTCSFFEQCRTAWPDHRELRIGTLLSIIRQSQLQRSLFEE